MFWSLDIQFSNWRPPPTNSKKPASGTPPRNPIKHDLEKATFQKCMAWFNQSQVSSLIKLRSQLSLTLLGKALEIKQELNHEKFKNTGSHNIWKIGYWRKSGSSPKMPQKRSGLEVKLAFPLLQCPSQQIVKTAAAHKRHWAIQMQHLHLTLDPITAQQHDGTLEMCQPTIQCWCIGRGKPTKHWPCMLTTQHQSKDS